MKDKSLEVRVRGCKEMMYFAEVCDLLLEVNVPMMYNAFYEQHKNKHGSYKKYLNNPKLYEEKMIERYNYCKQQVKQVITAKYKMKMGLK